MAKRLALAGDEQFCRRALLGLALLSPAARCHLHSSAADRFETYGAQHCRRKEGPRDVAWVHRQPGHSNIARASVRLQCIEGRRGR